MNTSMRSALLGLSVLGLAACAGMQERPDSAYVAPQHAAPVVDRDAAYVAQVESIARRRGIDVVWINAPRRHFGKTSSD